MVVEELGQVVRGQTMEALLHSGKMCELVALRSGEPAMCSQ